MSSLTSTASDHPSITFDQTSTMSTRLRSAWWNVHIYNADDTDTVLGGLFVDKGTTNANFYSMVEILVIFSGTFFLRDEGDTQIEKDNHLLQPGKYYIVATGRFLYNYPFIVRWLSDK